MRILIAHSRYQQPGGEETVVEQERNLLERSGHDVHVVERDNRDVRGGLRDALTALHSREAVAEVRALVERFEIDVVHVHNTLPLLSPSIFRTARSAGAAVVNTLHNYRIACVNGMLLREGERCELCVTRRLAMPGIIHGCYRGSRAASAVVAGSTAAHRAMGTFERQVDAYIAPSTLTRDILVSHGLDADRVHVKPHFIARDPGRSTGPRSGLVYAGRLSEEKGVLDLVDAWEDRVSDVPLHLFGTGPLEATLRERGTRAPRLQVHGAVSHARVLDAVGQAQALVVPSRARETFGMAALEAWARGTPVVAPEDGPLASYVDEDRGGSTFARSGSNSLAVALERVLAAAATDRSLAARAIFERHFTASRNLELVEAVYHEALARRGRLTGTTPGGDRPA